MRLEDSLDLQSAYIRFAGVSAPAVAPAGEARLWFDQANAQLKFSLNGGAYSAGLPIATAPPPSATQASLLLDSGSGGTAFNGSANGTVLGINLGTGTSDLINAQKAGAARFSVTETGIMTTLKAVIGGTTTVGTATITATDTNTIGLIVRPAVASPAANTFSIQNSAGTQNHVTFGGSSPFLGVSNSAFGIFYNGQISTSHRLGATADTASAVPLATKAIAAQTANLFQAIDNGGVVRAFIGSLVTVADATLTLRAITSQTGRLLLGRNAGDTADLFKFLVDGRAVAAVPNSAIADADLHNSSFSWYLDAGENNLIVKVKLAAGTIKTATIAIA